MVAGLNQAFGALCRVLEEDRPGTAARLLAAFEEAEDDPVESYSARVTEKMPSMLGASRSSCWVSASSRVRESLGPSGER